MYQHKLCSATYLPLDIEHGQASLPLAHTNYDLPSTRSSRKSRSPSLKFSHLLRHAHPSRSASIMSRRSTKTSTLGQERTPDYPSRSPPPSRFHSVKRKQRARPQLLPAFPSLSADSSVNIKVEKPLPSEPAFDFEKFFQRPVAMTTTRTRPVPRETKSEPLNKGTHDFAHNLPNSRSAPARYSFIYQMDTLEDSKTDRPSLLTGLHCKGAPKPSSAILPPSAGSYTDGQVDNRSGKGTYQLGTSLVDPAIVPRLTSHRKRIPKSRKPGQDAHVDAADTTFLQKESSWISKSVAGSGRGNDTSPTSLIKTESAQMSTETAHRNIRLQATKVKGSDTTDTEMSVNASVAINPGRPRLVSVSRRPSTTNSPVELIKPSTPQQNPKLVSAFSPDTPPETPEIHESTENLQHILTTTDSIQKILGTCITDLPQPITPPRSPSVSSRGIHLQTTDPRASIIVPDSMTQKSYRTFSTRAKQLNWILSQLEDSVASFPASMLQPNAPVIVEIRKQRKPHFVSKPTPQSSPSPSPSRPLSSHFLSRSHSRSSSFRFSPQIRQEGFSHQGADLDDNHLQPLRNIFPSSTDAFRHSLFATLVALNHISELLSSSFPPTSRQHYSLKVQDKARSRLGIRLPLLTSGSLERAQVRARIERLVEGLRMCARRMMEIMYGPELFGDMNEALLNAVGEVVRMIA